MRKIDLKKEYRQLYRPSAREVSVVDVPELQFAMLDGRIEAGQSPGESAAFQEAVGALYAISYALKFMSKKREVDPVDYGIMALEGLWWVDSGDFDFNRQEAWNYTLMILQPEHITAEMWHDALAEQMRKKPNPRLAELRLERFREGLSLQMMHVGPYADEPRTLAQMQAFAAANGYAYRGKHHEIYLGDPRRAAPEKLQTILRQPVEKVAG